MIKKSTSRVFVGKHAMIILLVVLSFFISVALAIPTYLDYSKNSTIAGENIEHRLRWEDAVGLSGYIFSFCNGTWNGTDCGATIETIEGEEWNTFIYNNNRSGNTAPTTLNLFSTYTTGGDVVTSPAIYGDYVYIGSYDNNLYQLDASNISNKIANYTTGGDIQSSPLVVNGFVYVGSVDNKVYQLNASNVSQLISTFTTGGDVVSSPAYDGGYIYVGSFDTNLYQLNATNISQEINRFSEATGDMYGSPLIVGDYVYIGNGGDSIFYQLNKTNISLLINSYDTGSLGIDASPSYWNGYVYIGDWNDVFYQFNATNVSQLISSYQTGDLIFSTATFNNGYVYFGSFDNKFYQLNASNVSQAINILTTGDNIWASPSSSNEYVFIGGVDNIFYMLNATNISEIISNYTGTEDFVASSIANGFVYVGSNDNKLYQFNNSGTTNWVNSSWVSMTGTLNWSNVTKTVNSTVGANIAYMYYANDSSGNWNETIIFSYLTTSADITPPILTIASPLNQTYSYSNIWFNITADENISACLVDYGAGNKTLSNTSMTAWYHNNASVAEGSHQAIFWCNDTSGNPNTTSVYFTVDITPPAVSAYYQWNSTNDTVDFGPWTEGFVSVNWNLTDATGINTSTCQIKVRNKNSVTNYTNHSYIDDLTHPDYDPVTGYKNLTCYTEDLGGGITRVSANMTRSYDWRPLNTAFEQDNAAHDNIYYSFGGRSTKIVFHNITNTINTTFIFLADIDNQSATVADHLFYSCNLSYTNGDYTTDPNCAFVGAGTTNATRDVNFGYVIGALTTDENGTFGGVVHTETMYGISYCPDCTNTNNAWITYSTDGYDGHSETSANQGTTWSALSGEEFNVILHVIDNLQLEFNLTIDDTPGNTLSDLQIDTYGVLANLAPYGDIMTDNVTGSLVSYYDIHGIIETGTIWINTTIADPNEDSMNCSVYLLNNDSSVNQTLLANYSVEGYGICPYEWNTTNFTDGDYRLNVTSTDGLLTGHDESAGYIRIDNTAPTINELIEAGNPNENVFGTDTSSHYYRNGTWQTENWINITVNVTDDATVDKVFVEWKNETGWINYTMTSSGDIHTINITSQPNYGFYTFNIWANDSLGNIAKIYNWTFYDYEAVWGTHEEWRKYVGLSAVAEEFSYEQFYLYNATYDSDKINDRALLHEQPIDGTLTDTGYAYYTAPSVTQERFCSYYTGFYPDETFQMNDTVIENIYSHIWWGSNNGLLGLGYKKQNTASLGTTQDEWYEVYASNARMNISLSGFSQTDYYLESRFWNISNPTFEDNEINIFAFKPKGAGTNHPSVISFINDTHKYISFFILNLPDNTTLEGLDTDYDGLSDYDELFEHWTDPKRSDTDGGGESDYSEVSNGRNPLDGYDDVDVPPTLTIVSPTNQTYSISNIWFNITADEALSTCLVDYGAGNKTLSNTSLVSWYHNNASVVEGSHQAIFWCNDTSGNPNTTSVYFNITLDTTDPIISSVTASSITSSTAIITWTTDENANSSLSISPAGTYSNSASYTTPHSIAVSGLSAETNYTYNVTSCDASGNCAEDTGNTFETIAAEDGGGGGGGGCTPSWICTDWSSCIDRLQTRTCEDENKCDDNSSMPDLSQACTIAPSTTPLNKTNFTIADMGNYTWPFSPDDEGLYHPTRFAAVVSSLMAGNLGAMMMNIVASFGDYYYRPSFGWGLLNILFMHITPFVGLYLLLGLLIRYSKMLSKTSTTFKFVIYFIVIPLFVLFMTLLMPSV